MIPLLLFLLSLVPSAHADDVVPYHDFISLHARRYGFAPELIESQVWAESGFRPEAESPVGARGLMQIMPGTAKWLKVDPDMLWTPEVNIQLGVYYDFKIHSIFKREKEYHRIAFMLAGYNAGPGRVISAQDKAIRDDVWNDEVGIKLHLPKETQLYVEKIFKRWIRKIPLHH